MITSAPQNWFTKIRKTDNVYDAASTKFRRRWELKGALARSGIDAEPLSAYLMQITALASPPL